MKGRKPMSSEVLKSHGTKNKPRRPKMKQATKGDIRIPPIVKANDYAAKEWKKVTKLLKDAGVLSSTDVSALTIYCLSLERMMELVEFVQANGIKDQNGKPRQELRLIKNEWEKIKFLLVEFGLTPTAKNRIVVSDDVKTKVGDSLEDLLD